MARGGAARKVSPLVTPLMGSLAALVSGNLKLIEQRGRWFRLFDLLADRAERNEVSAAQPKQVLDMRRLLRRTRDAP